MWYVGKVGDIEEKKSSSGKLMGEAAGMHYSHIHMMVGMLCRQVHSLRAKLTPTPLIPLSYINPKYN